MQFTLRHCWKVLKVSPKWMESEVPKFLSHPQASKRYKTSGSSSFNMESGDASINLNVDVGDGEEHEEYKQRQEDIRFYMEPYDHLTGDALIHMEALRAEIKAKWNLPF
ncbi:RNA-directed DNA polymerase, eukaryota, reverse transcriptase zinc-binding domain protein [Tanacetum coccineum]|uniref:RNA-directed DNA polymerase, eukaryota, reverse transcriptase zinc-binding domain protein n=1 Tax=Tanacetum coccineum TaxID=301880 RepID=A0ABQ5FUI4_9ASTR